MLVRDLMERDVLTLRGDLSIGDACDLFQQARVQGAPVVDEKGRLLGFVSQEDLLYGSMGAPSPPARAITKSRQAPDAEGRLQVLGMPEAIHGSHRDDL